MSGRAARRSRAPTDACVPLPLPLGMDTAAEEGLSIAPDTPKDPLDLQADSNSPSVSRPLNVRLIHVSMPSVAGGQVDDSGRPGRRPSSQLPARLALAWLADMPVP